MATDRFQSHDYYQMDELLTEEHKLIRNSVREWVKKEVSPVVEEACQKAEFPKQWIKGLAEIGAFGRPEKRTAMPPCQGGAAKGKACL